MPLNKGTNLSKRLKKKLDGYSTKMLYVVLKIFRRQHPTKEQLYGHLLPISQTIKRRRVWHDGHFWRSKEVLIHNVIIIIIKSRWKQISLTLSHLSTKKYVSLNWVKIFLKNRSVCVCVCVCVYVVFLCKCHHVVRKKTLWRLYISVCNMKQPAG